MPLPFSQEIDSLDTFSLFLHHWHAKRLGDSLRWSGGFGKGGFEINRMTIYDADFGKNGKDLPARQEILKGLKGTYNTGI